MRRLINIAFFALLLLASCKEESNYGQYPVESTPPGKVTNIEYEALPGAVKLKYELPMDKDLLYVKAAYQLDNKEWKEAKASAYTNELLLEGFGVGDSTRQVRVIAVDVNQNESEVALIDVVPEASPVYEVIKTVSGVATFGGVKISWTNPKDFNVILVLNRENEAGQMIQPVGGRIYAEGNGKEDSRSIQGIDSIMTRFTVHVEDRWGNRSSKYEFMAKPMFEELIDKSSFRRWNPSNAQGTDQIKYQAWWGFDIEKIWDGLHPGNHSSDNCYSTAQGNKENRITFDMVSQIKPSRMKLWARKNYKYSAIGEYIRVWGSNDPEGLPTFDQTVEPIEKRWTLLTEEQGPKGGYHVYKPSGLPGTQVTSGDVQYAEVDGIDIYFKADIPTVRYICIEMVSMWSGGSTGSFTIAEVDFYGQYVKK